MSSYSRTQGPCPPTLPSMSCRPRDLASGLAGGALCLIPASGAWGAMTSLLPWASPPGLLSGEPAPASYLPVQPASPPGASGGLCVRAEEEGTETPSLPSSADHSGHRFVTWGVCPKLTSRTSKASHVCVQNWAGHWGHPPRVMPGLCAGAVPSTPTAREMRGGRCSAGLSKCHSWKCGSQKPGCPFSVLSSGPLAPLTGLGCRPLPKDWVPLPGRVTGLARPPRSSMLSAAEASATCTTRCFSRPWAHGANSKPTCLQVLGQQPDTSSRVNRPPQSVDH